MYPALTALSRYVTPFPRRLEGQHVETQTSQLYRLARRSTLSASWDVPVDVLADDFMIEKVVPWYRQVFDLHDTINWYWKLVPHLATDRRQE